MFRPPPSSPLFPYTTLSRPQPSKPPVLQATTTGDAARWAAEQRSALRALVAEHGTLLVRGLGLRDGAETEAVFRQLGDRKSTRLNSSHSQISYAVFCLKQKP